MAAANNNRICIADDCDNPATRGQLCDKHSYASKKHGYELALKNLAICSVDGCQSTAHLSGKSPRCEYHKVTCSHIGCERPRDKKANLCGMHSSRRHRAKVAAAGLKCETPFCSLPVEAMGLCSKHYVKLRRYGSVEAAPGIERGAPLRWIHHLVNTLPLPNTCIEWPFNMDVHGYGSLWAEIKDARRNLKAHRVVLALYAGTSIDSLPPRDISTRHICPGKHNRRCVNPLHLSFGTHAENMADSAEHGTQKGSKNPGSKLNEDQVLNILLDGRCYREIALDYNISRGQINTIKKRHQWQHVMLPSGRTN